MPCPVGHAAGFHGSARRITGEPPPYARATFKPTRRADRLATATVPREEKVIDTYQLADYSGSIDDDTGGINTHNHFVHTVFKSRLDLAEYLSWC